MNKVVSGIERIGAFAVSMTLVASIASAGTELTLQGDAGVQRVRVGVAGRDSATANFQERLLHPGPESSYEWSGTSDHELGRGRFITKSGYDYEARVAYLASRTVLAAGSGEEGAAVGLYPSLSSSTLPADSMMSVDVYRNPDFKELTLSLRGGLRSWSSGRQIPKASFKLIVFPDLMTADQDRSNRGDGSLFYGELSLSDKVSTEGAFVSSDFIVQEQSGERTVRPSGTISIHLNVPDAEMAVVRLIADSGDESWTNAPQSAPGVSPLGLGLLAVLLVTAGCWSLSRSNGRVEQRMS